MSGSTLARCTVLILGGLACASAQAVTDFFDSTKIHEIHVSISPSDYRALQQAAWDDKTYYPCTFTWNNITLAGEVRQKGRASRNPYKPSLKFKFSKKNRFLGLRELELKSNVQDGSQVHQIVSMEVFDRMGLPGRRQSHAKVYVNDEFVGLYLSVEFVNEDYLARVFNNSDGVLYDFGPDPSYNFEYKGDDPSPYLVNFDPDQPDDPDHGPLVAMIKAINLSSDAEFKDSVGQFLDWQQFLSYLAVEQYDSQDDGLAGEWGTNNFYLYRNTSTGKFVFIPTDRDMEFTLIDTPLLQHVDQNVLTRRALDNPELRAMFYEAVKRVIAVTGGQDGWLQRTIEWRINMIRSTVYSDPNKRCDFAPCTNARFEEFANYLFRFAVERPELAMAQITAAGIPVSSSQLSAPGVLSANSTAQVSWPGQNMVDGAVWVNGFPAKIVSSGSGQLVFEAPGELWTGSSPLWVVTSAGDSASLQVTVRGN